MPTGEIERTAPLGLDSLLDTPLRTGDQEGPDESAVRQLRHIEVGNERLRISAYAVRNLFDVLEKIRPFVKEEMLKGDERDLFNIANNFSVRHLNESQKGNYEGPLWYSWMFYVNLATIHLVTRIQTRVAQ